MKRIDYKLLHENIKTIARHKGIKMGEIEEQAGTKAGYFARIERDDGCRQISAEILINVAKILGVSIETLLYELPKINADACPFCGGEPAMSGGGLGVYYVTCSACHAQGPEGISAASAEALWNDRIYGGGEMYNWGLIFKEGKNGE